MTYLPKQVLTTSTQTLKLCCLKSALLNSVRKFSTFLWYLKVHSCVHISPPMTQQKVSLDILDKYLRILDRWKNPSSFQQLFTPLTLFSNTNCSENTLTYKILWSTSLLFSISSLVTGNDIYNQSMLLWEFIMV